MVHQASQLRSFNVPSVLKCCSVCYMGLRTQGGEGWAGRKAQVMASTDLAANRSLSLIHSMLLGRLFTKSSLTFLIYTMRATSYLERLLKTQREFPFGKDLSPVILKNISSPSKSLLQISCPFLLKASLFLLRFKTLESTLAPPLTPFNPISCQVLFSSLLYFPLLL